MSLNRVERAHLDKCVDAIIQVASRMLTEQKKQFDEAITKMEKLHSHIDRLEQSIEEKRILHLFGKRKNGIPIKGTVKA